RFVRRRGRDVVVQVGAQVALPEVHGDVAQRACTVVLVGQHGLVSIRATCTAAGTVDGGALGPVRVSAVLGFVVIPPAIGLAAGVPVTVGGEDGEAQAATDVVD